MHPDEGHRPLFMTTYGFSFDAYIELLYVNYFYII